MSKSLVMYSIMGSTLRSLLMYFKGLVFLILTLKISKILALMLFFYYLANNSIKIYFTWFKILLRVYLWVVCGLFLIVLRIVFNNVSLLLLSKRLKMPLMIEGRLGCCCWVCSYLRLFLILMTGCGWVPLLKQFSHRS